MASHLMDMNIIFWENLTDPYHEIMKLNQVSACQSAGTLASVIIDRAVLSISNRLLYKFVL